VNRILRLRISYIRALSPGHDSLRHPAASGRIPGIGRRQKGLERLLLTPSGSSLHNIERSFAMRRILAVLFAVLAIQTLTACATAAGTAIGAGIGATQGETAKGAAIGAGVGAVIDIVD
jgi:hypothetical protein